MSINNTPNLYPQYEYLSVKDTAKIVRGALAKAFPGIKFSVRSETYSGGASINVQWTDGPTAQMVDNVVQAYRGKDFDGMIDMATSRGHWLMPDGTATCAHFQGTEGQRGSIREFFGDAPGAGARLVRFGADYIHTRREHSFEMFKRVQEFYKAKYGYLVPLCTYSSGDGVYFDPMAEGESNGGELGTAQHANYILHRSFLHDGRLHIAKNEVTGRY
jgi:hypothetical protein